MQTTRLTSADFDKMIIESIDEVMAYDRGNGELKFWFDQIKSGELTSDAEVVYAEGRQGVQLAAFDRNKTAGFTCENGYVLASAIATQLGSDLEVATETDKLTIQVQDFFKQAKGATTIKREGGTDEAAKSYALSATAEADTMKFVYKIGNDNSIVKKIEVVDVEQVATLPAAGATYLGKYVEVTGDTDPGLYLGVDEGTGGTHAYAWDDVTITADNELFSVSDDGTTLTAYLVAAEADTTYLAVYDTKVSIGKKIVNRGDRFAGNVKLVINFVAQDPCSGNKYLMQAIMPNAKVSGSFSLAAGDDPAVQNFEATAMLDICSVDKELFTIVMA